MAAMPYYNLNSTGSLDTYDFTVGSSNGHNSSVTSQIIWDLNRQLGEKENIIKELEEEIRYLKALVEP